MAPEPSESTIKITKLDAACRQLNTAIYLWFTEGDPISVFALAHAAHEIIHTLYRRKGLVDLIYDSDFINDNYRGDWAKRLKHGAAFLKHAKRDPDAVLEFNPNLTMTHIMGCVMGLSRMGYAPSDEIAALLAWLYVHRPTWFRSKRVESFLPAKELQEFRRVKKPQFFELYLQALRNGVIERLPGTT
jgi:hypothetical protein